MSVATSSGACAAPVIELPEILDLKAAAALAAEFLGHRGEELTVDASRVRRLGGQCLQVLLSAAMTWRADEVLLAFVNPSPDFVEGLARLGIARADFIDQEQPQ
ncbi:STAS domain-containing protein [Methylocapsa acidiphila]|uniref:STAS domain-containing protein n=1 Tax=Methylocapsa acidiphila TaxID=133552 RepID=UPI0004150DFC|nr:STAS domain-containing protein [Methylocapsa acidiphila]